MAVAARYVNRELIGVLLVVVAVLLAVTVGGRFISYLQDAALGKFSADSIATILYYRLPGFLQLLVPFAFYLTLLLTLGRLHAEQEFEVLRGGGVGPARLLGWLAPLGLLVAGGVGYCSLVLAPDFDRQLTEFLRDQQADAEFGVVSPGIFHLNYRGQRVTYADSVAEDQQALEDVFMAEFKAGDGTVTVRAERGAQEIDPETGQRYLVLSNGYRHLGLPGHSDYQIVSFSRLKQRIEEEVRSTRFGIEALSTAELRDRGDPEAQAELHFRMALPLVVVIGGLMAVGVGRTKPRQGRFARLVPGLGLFVLYYAGLIFNRDAISDGQIPAQAGMWLVHGSFLVVGVVLLRQSSLPAKA